MLELYRFPGATCAAKVMMALHEKRLTFVDRVLERSALSQPWYRALNPQGVVPTLVHDGVAIIESSVILHYIDDAFAHGPALRPQDAPARARMNGWLKHVDDMLVHLGTMTYAIASRQRYLAQPPAMRDAYYATIPDPYLRQSRRDAIELGLAAPGARHALAQLRAMQARAADDLSAGAYLCGTFGLADIALAPFIWRMDALGILDAAPENPALHDWWVRIRQRRGFRDGVARSAPPDLTAGLRQSAAEQRDSIAALRA